MVTLTGFTNNLITLLDVSQPLAPVVVTNLLVEPDGGQWRASFVSAAGDARYSVVQDRSLLEPLAVEAVWPLNLAIAAGLRCTRRQRHLRLPESPGEGRQPGAAALGDDTLRSDRVGQ